MFDFFKRKAKPSATATDESKPLWVELFDTQPVDSEGSLIALDDLVSYRGEVCAALINQSYETVTLEAGTRVCQLVVMPYVPCELVPVDELSDTERGAGGFGSTGVE